MEIDLPSNWDTLILYEDGLRIVAHNINVFVWYQPYGYTTAGCFLNFVFKDIYNKMETIDNCQAWLRTIFTGLLALGSIGSLIAFVRFNKRAQRQAQITNLNELVRQKAKECNDLYLNRNGSLGEPVPDELYGVVHEINVAVELLNMRLNALKKSLRFQEAQFLSVFWIQLHPYLRYRILEVQDDELHLVQPKTNHKLFWNRWFTLIEKFKSEIEKDKKIREKAHKQFSQ